MIAGQRTKKSIPSSCLVYTPELVANAMVNTLNSCPEDDWLEPCIGEGALLTALANAGVKRGQITGIDLQKRPRPNDRLASTFRGVEFLSWAKSTDKRFNKIIANPPYVALERVSNTVRNAALRITAFDEIAVTNASNTWFAFLCASLQLLRLNGSLCFLLPAAWEYANYARELRKEFPRRFRSVTVYRSSTPLFKNVDIHDGAILLVAKHLLPPLAQLTNYPSTISHKLVSSAEDLARRIASNHQELAYAPSAQSKLHTPSHSCRRLGDLIDISIGGVTGDANYFLLSETERRNWRLPRMALTPVISRARYLRNYEITKTAWTKLLDNDERVWLFNPRGKSLRNPAVARYLKWGQRKGCNVTNHKIAIRQPWYGTKLPTSVDGFMSGMAEVGPWIAFSKMKNLTATNTLYVVSFKTAQTFKDRYAIALGLLTSFAGSEFLASCRRYADGLGKYELEDIRNARIPVAPSSKGARQTYRKVVKLMIRGKSTQARRLADCWFSNANISRL